MSIIRDTGVERIVVVDSKGKLVGLVDELDLFKAQSTDRFRVRGGPVSVKPTTSIGELSGEKYKMRLISIAGLVRKSIPIVKQNYSIQKVIEAMIEKELPVAVVIEKEKPIGIITTKPILRLIGRPLEGILVQLSGIQQEDIYMKAIIDEQIVNAVRKWAKFVPIKHIAIHIDRYQSTGKRIKYSIKARLIGYKGMWFADDHAWDITKAMRGVLTKLEQEILKSKSKAETRTRGPTVHFTEMPSL
jgi:CBS domain-containing protein/ribosome-associated translation inhibitor RaiA